MKKNIGVSDRIIRFVLMDLILGSTYLGLELPYAIHVITFFISIGLVLTILSGYSPMYHYFGIDTREQSPQNSGSDFLQKN